MTDSIEEIRVVFRLWGPMRLAARQETIAVRLPAKSGAARLSAALDILYRSFPALAPHRASARVAIGNDYVRDDRPLQGGEEISLIPPVQGG
ncbi:MAG: MoaD/ThiS family protein [Candidatus Eisenbacteria bacterium]